MAIGDHIRSTIGQLEMQQKLPTDRRNFDISSPNEATAPLRSERDTGSMPYGTQSQRTFDATNKSYRRPANRKNNEMIGPYDLDDNGSRRGVAAGCEDLKSNFYSKCNFTVVALILGIICLVQLTILIILAVRLTSESRVESGRSSHEGKLSLTMTMSGKAFPGELIFYDDFDILNNSVWRHDRYLSADGFVFYGSNPNNSYVEDGVLVIQPTFTAQDLSERFLYSGRLIVGKTVEESCSSFYRPQCDKQAKQPYSILNPIMSASIRTSQSFAFQYGVLEIRAKMPKGDWISTDISLSPRYEFYGEPTDSAKIVLITTKGNVDYYDQNHTHQGQERFCTQLIYSESVAVPRSSMIPLCHNSEPGNGFGEDFHTYKFEWEPDLLKVSVDNKLVGKFIANTVAPAVVKHVAVSSDNENKDSGNSFNQQFYVSIKVGIGVGFPDEGFYPVAASGAAKPWKNNTPEGVFRFWSNRKTWEKTWVNGSALLVDYIRVHAL